MFLRVSNPSTTNAVSLDDLGISVPANALNFVISDQFTESELAESLSLITSIKTGVLTSEVNLHGTWTPVTPATFGQEDILSAAMNVYEIAKKTDNKDLVGSGEAGNLHHHDAFYFRKPEISSQTIANPGAGLVGIDESVLAHLAPLPQKTVQGFAKAVNDAFITLVTLDKAYTNDTDGILDINGSGKPFVMQSNNVNEVAMTRKSGVDIQDLFRAKVGANEVVIGAAAVGALAAVNVRIKTNLIVEGNLQYNGTIEDTTVNNMNVKNQRITMNDGQSVGMDAFIAVDRGATGNDAVVKWNETTQRWMSGVEGTEQTVALLEADESITGTYKFGQGAAANSAMTFSRKAAAPTAKLGTATEAPVDMIGDLLCVYDKTNSRNKWLSVYRFQMSFTGRDAATNTNEYARVCGAFTSNQGGYRLMRNATLVGISCENKGAQTWTARIRRNGSVTNLASLAVSSAVGAQDITYNVDFSAGDDIEVYIEGSNINRPVITLEFAYRA